MLGYGSRVSGRGRPGRTGMAAVKSGPSLIRRPRFKPGYVIGAQVKLYFPSPPDRQVHSPTLHPPSPGAHPIQPLEMRADVTKFF